MMTFELSTIVLVVVAYVLVTFGIATLTNRGWLPDSFINHPVTYILSLGVFASTWAYYGVVDLAYQYGYGALTYYIGIVALFLFAPVALTPIAQLVQRFKIPSVADLLVFRYHSQLVGSVVTLCMMAAVMPLVAMQIQAVAESLSILTNYTPEKSSHFDFEKMFALGYCLLLLVFGLLFGASREKQRGLVMALAFESLIKILAITAVGLFAVFQVFGSLDGIDQWLAQNPDQQKLLYTALSDNSTHTLLLVFIATAVAMPHLFQSSVVDVPVARSMRFASWAFPLFLFCMAAPILPILWAGFALDVPLPVQYYTLGVPFVSEQPGLTMLAFIGGLSAATGAIISITMAGTVMVLNHWLLPMSRLGQKRDLRRRIVWLRRTTMGGILAAAYLFYLITGGDHRLMELALTTFVAMLQFLPAIIAVTYWSRANRFGLLAGMCAGATVWFWCLLLPVMFEVSQVSLPFWGTVALGIDAWNSIALVSLALNIGLFVLVSMNTEQNAEEQFSASLCTEAEIAQPVRVILDVHSCDEIKERLSRSLGATLAEIQVNKAAEELGYSFSERRPYSLRRIRNRLETNLSSMMGRSVASEIIDRHLPYRLPSQAGNTDINLMESRLHRYRDRLTGMAAELDSLRLYHRNTIYELPMAVCSLGSDLEVITWNRSMEELTSIQSGDVAGAHLSDLSSPWRELIIDFTDSEERHLHGQLVKVDGKERFFSLHKSPLHTPKAIGEEDGQVILIEEITELKLLEQELTHSERLASIGRLSAGVAHEIGNPVTGIACLAQNLKYDSDAPEVLETAEQILSQTHRISSIVHSLVTFSHSGSHNPRQCSAVEVQSFVSEAIALLSLQKDDVQVTYQSFVPAHLRVMGDTQKLIQVFINLLSNARDASEDGDTVVIEAEAEAGEVAISVSDQGSGIDPDHIDQIIEPFFTTKEPGKGTGLGLAMVYSIIDEHDGSIRVESPLDKQSQTGTRFIITLPEGVEPSPE
ncbi:ATP-binding protein [Halioxenophilus aromaticivorans]|uniref:histidine kinase n=1 Tax=Halioxenophilus aromaticivorans TaxID=1306992 RepID=A0AAV3U9U4_9ALTE